MVWGLSRVLFHKSLRKLKLNFFPLFEHTVEKIHEILNWNCTYFTEKMKTPFGVSFFKTKI